MNRAMEAIITDYFLPDSTLNMLKLDNKPDNHSSVGTKVYNQPRRRIKKIGKLFPRHRAPPGKETHLIIVID